MMMECPRCGFSQPKDQYCASCGVNVDHLLAKPKPFWSRLLANPNFHLSLIGGLIVLVVGWIFFTQSALVNREVRRVLDLPVSSRNAGEPGDPLSKAIPEQFDILEEAEDENEDQAAPVPAAAVGAVGVGESRTPEEILAAAVGAPPPPGSKAAVAAGDPQTIQILSWEVPRETLTALFTSGQRVGEGLGGRSYAWAQGAKVLETLQTTGQALGAGKVAPLAANAQLFQITPPTAPEMFQFDIAIQVTKFENKEATLRWAINYALPQPEPPGQAAPAMRQVLEGSFTGNGTLTAQSLVMIVMEPMNRVAREDYLTKAGEGPWSVFASPEFRSGLTDWVMVIQLK